MSKKIKTEQFGVRFPDGRIQWDDGSTFIKLKTQEERDAYVKDRDERLRNEGVTGDTGLVFLRRYRIVSHSEPEIV